MMGIVGAPLSKGVPFCLRYDTSEEGMMMWFFWSYRKCGHQRRDGRKGRKFRFMILPSIVGINSRLFRGNRRRR